MNNIIFLVSNLNSGGMENYLLRFLTESSKNFNQIYVWCKNGKDGQLDNNYLALNNVTLIKKKLGYFDIISYINLENFIIEKKINAICDFSGNFSGRVIYSAKKVGVKKRVAAYRGSSDHFNKGFLKNIYNQWVKRLVYKHATNILSNSKAAFDYFYPHIWKNDKRFSVIYNGINSTKFISEKYNLKNEFSIPINCFVIGHTGRFNSAKNHATIIATAEILIKKHHDIYFILCGNGVKENLQEILKEKRIDNKVLIFENRNDIPCFLNTMDCYFFPSTTEGQPNSLIEAMIMGLPFIASDIPAIRETVGDKYKLYPALNVDILASALEEQYLIKKSRDLIQQKETIQRFDYKKRFDEFLKILLNL